MATNLYFNNDGYYVGVIMKSDLNPFDFMDSECLRLTAGDAPGISYNYQPFTQDVLTNTGSII